MNSGQFTPIAASGSPFSQVHFFPKNGNQIIIEGKQRKIPPGVGVVWGGVVGTYNDASIDKVPHKTLAPNTLYFVYVYWLAGQMLMDFSLMTHREDQYFGNEVHAMDPARSLVGMVYTDASGKFVGDATRQNTLSWFNPCRTVLSRQIAATSVSTAWEEIANKRLEWLQWGINSTFNEASIRSLIHFNGYGSNNTIDKSIGIAIGYNSAIAPAGVSVSQSNPAGNLQSLASTVAGPMSEGHHYAQPFIMASGGGTATLNDSTFSLNVLTS